MPAVNSNFKGHDYAIDEEGKILINGQAIEVEKTDDGRYLSPNLPYQSYSSLQQLVEQLIDSSPDYKTF